MSALLVRRLERRGFKPKPEGTSNSIDGNLWIDQVIQNQKKKIRQTSDFSTAKFMLEDREQWLKPQEKLMSPQNFMFGQTAVPVKKQQANNFKYQELREYCSLEEFTRDTLWSTKR